MLYLYVHNQFLLVGCLIRHDLESLVCLFSASELKLCGHVCQSQPHVFTGKIYISSLQMWTLVCQGYLAAFTPQAALPVLLSIHSGRSSPWDRLDITWLHWWDDLSRSLIPVRGIPAAWQQLPCWHSVTGERLRFGKLSGVDETQAKEAAATTSSSLGGGWVFSLPPALPTSPSSPSSAHFSTSWKCICSSFCLYQWLLEERVWYFGFNTSRSSVLVATS